VPYALSKNTEPMLCVPIMIREKELFYWVTTFAYERESQCKSRAAKKL